MCKKLKEKVRGIFQKGKGVVKTITLALSLGIMLAPTRVYAAASYTAPLTKLKTVMLVVLTAFGAPILIYGIAKFAISLKNLDQNGEHQAIYTIAAGGILVGADFVVAAIM